ncbi:MAG: hypothetical protein KDD61_07645, partial [Bdellovibrionales bacterium]|nr:hypothetical protein [Bdellovibrionales bacterium]
MSPPAAPPLFEIVKTTLGATSIRNNVVNEIMHNPVGPWKEANILYVDQTQFRRRLWEPFSSQQRFFTVFDVGLGAGANAAAILTAFQEEKAKGCKASLCLVSFEIDLRLMKFTLKHLDHFPELIPFGEAFSTLLEKHHWQGPDIEWYLRKGSFTDKIALESHLANLVLYDAYSPKKNPEMWSYKTFRDLYQKCRKENEGACSL